MLNPQRINFPAGYKYNLDHIDDTRLPPVENLIFDTKIEKFKWATETTELFRDWRLAIRDKYIRWSLSINGLEVAANRYSGEDWIDKKKRFNVHSLRLNQQNKLDYFSIADWDGEFAAKSHKETMAMLSAWGVIDLHGCLEEYIFKMYTIYLNSNPTNLLKGAEYNDLRRLYKNQKTDYSLKDEWTIKWQERLESWQRKKLYGGLKNVFLSYCTTAGIKKPTTCKNTGPLEWAETIDGISLLRNCLVHGVKKVPKELSVFSTKPNRMTFDFKENEELKVTVHHLMGIEYFCGQLLWHLNIALLESIDEKQY